MWRSTPSLVAVERLDAIYARSYQDTRLSPGRCMSPKEETPLKPLNTKRDEYNRLFFCYSIFRLVQSPVKIGSMKRRASCFPGRGQKVKSNHHRIPRRCIECAATISSIRKEVARMRTRATPAMIAAALGTRLCFGAA